MMQAAAVVPDAKRLRAALRAAYPHAKFVVRELAPDQLDVIWVGGPPQRDVAAALAATDDGIRLRRFVRRDHFNAALHAILAEHGIEDPLVVVDGTHSALALACARFDRALPTSPYIEQYADRLISIS